MEKITDQIYIAAIGKMIIRKSTKEIVQIISNIGDNWLVVPQRNIEDRLRIPTAVPVSVNVNDLRILNHKDLVNGDAIEVWEKGQAVPYLVQGGHVCESENGKTVTAENLKNMPIVIADVERYPEDESQINQREMLLNVTDAHLEKLCDEVLEITKGEDLTFDQRAAHVGAITLSAAMIASEKVAKAFQQEGQSDRYTGAQLLVVGVSHAVRQMEVTGIVPDFLEMLNKGVKALEKAEEPVDTRTLN